MAPSGLFLTHARRSQLPHLLRLFSSSSSSSTPPSRAPAPVQPISYPAKPNPPSEQPEGPTDPSPPSPTPTQSRPQRLPSGSPLDSDSRAWTREDARYVRDTTAVSPVSYQSRVAPLPEYKPDEEGKGEAGGERLPNEAQQIRAFTGVLRNLEGQEEVEKVPFPRLIRSETAKPKASLDLQKAIKEVKANAKRNFLETVEAHVRLGVNPRRSDQTVRGAVSLPHGTGKDVRIAVFVEGAQADEARAAGADVVGGDELIEEIKRGGGKLNFDKCISTPAFMPRLGKEIARILGPRGLMPNPKLGSVTSNVAAAVKEAKRGRIDFKMDKSAIVHVGIGKVNFSEESLRENIGAFVNALLLAKPAGLKKTSRYAGYVNSFSLSSTMGPGFPVSIQSVSEAADNYNKLHPKVSA